MALLGRPLDSQLNVEMNLVRVLKETKNTEIYITLNIQKKVFLLQQWLASVHSRQSTLPNWEVMEKATGLE